MSTREKYLYPKTVKGKAYLYFRQPDGKLTRLPTDQTSAEFAAIYDECLAAMAPAPAAQPIAARPSGSIGTAIDIYLDSIEYRAVKPRTQQRYADACKIIRDELGTCRLADLKISNLDVYSERITKTRGASIADLHTSLIKIIFDVCRKHAQFGIADIVNPAINAERRYKVVHAHRAWSDEAISKFLASAPEHMRLALLLCWITGQRGGDVVKMRWSDFNGSVIKVRQEKTNGEADAEAHECYCTDQLVNALKSAPRRSEFILTKPDGRPFATANLLGKAFRRELVKIGMSQFCMHGLRCRAAKDAAEIGGVEAAMAVTGHKSRRMADYYSKGASKRRMATLVAAERSSSWQPQVITGGKAA